MLPEHQFLNSSQQLAVKTIKGRVLILAGAGSGKTKVLTIRIAHLISDHQVHPSAILGLTFTNKAAAEMRHRMSKYLNEKQAKELTLGTFHSFCMGVLRKEIEHLGYTRHFSLYDSYDVQRVITQICRELLNHESTLPSLTPTIAAINKARSKGISSEQLTPGHQWHDHFVKKVYQKFTDSMRAYNAVDFDDLIILTVKLFEQHPEVLTRYQNRYQYIMIDEYQDTNPIQYRLASLLSQKHHNLCVVGDDDQSIYGWRGAEIKNILNFNNATVIKLEQNYRSTNTILKAANSVIKHNQGRHDKSLWSNQGEGSLIEVFHAPNEINEAEAVVHRIATLKESKGINWNDIAILYRSNALSRLFEIALLKYTWKNGEQWQRGIPYQIFGGEEYYERREVKDLMAYLRAILNQNDQEALLRIINVPRRGIGDDTLDKITSYNRANGISLSKVLSIISHENENQLPFTIPEKAKKNIRKLLNIFEEAKERFNTAQLPQTLEWLIEQIEFKKAIYEDVKSEKMRAFKWENVQEFISSIAEYQDQLKMEGRSHEASLHDFVTSTPLGKENSFNKKKDAAKNAVNLMTFHSAKGLEFKACFLVGMEDHIIPHEKSLLETGIEEERRLMYVALTRAKNHLTCSMARQRKQMGKDTLSKPSRFLSDIPKELFYISSWNN